jgi:hypothetical protein
MTDLFALFLRPLEHGGFEYMVGGSVAAMTYGEPRLTNDIDIVLDLRVQDLDRLAEVFPEEKYYRAPSEVLRMELARAARGHTNLIHHATGFRADVYFRASDPLHSWAWPRRLRIETGEGLRVSIAPVEYVILRKLEYYLEGGSEKHISDIRNILHLQPELRESPEIAAWSERLGVLALWLKAVQPG